MGVWTIAAAIIALLMFAWVIPAYVSGTFIPEDGRWSVTPGEFTPDAMAVHKQLIQLDGQKIAYIDIGRGEPVIGCPFSVLEWRAVAPLLAKSFRVIAPT
jgi:hypothetical protein